MIIYNSKIDFNLKVIFIKIMYFYIIFDPWGWGWGWGWAQPQPPTPTPTPPPIVFFI